MKHIILVTLLSAISFNLHAKSSITEAKEEDPPEVTLGEKLFHSKISKWRSYQNEIKYGGGASELHT